MLVDPAAVSVSPGVCPHVLLPAVSELEGRENGVDNGAWWCPKIEFKLIWEARSSDMLSRSLHESARGRAEFLCSKPCMR